MTETGKAPEVELRLYQIVHAYEVVKLVLLTVVIVALAIGSFAVARILSHQYEQLAILRCATSQEVQDARLHAGKDLTARDRAARTAYDLCVKRGHPIRNR